MSPFERGSTNFYGDVADRQRERGMDGKTDRWTDRQDSQREGTDGQTDRQSCRRTDRQTEWERDMDGQTWQTRLKLEIFFEFEFWIKDRTQKSLKLNLWFKTRTWLNSKFHFRVLHWLNFFTSDHQTLLSFQGQTRQRVYWFWHGIIGFCSELHEIILLY